MYHQENQGNGNELQLCTKNKLKCSKEKGHHGRCNKDRSLLFWKSSPILLKKEVQSLKDTKESLTVQNSAKGIYIYTSNSYIYIADCNNIH